MYRFAGPTDRRYFLTRTAGGLGLAALASLLADNGLLADDTDSL